MPKRVGKREKRQRTAARRATPQPDDHFSLAGVNMARWGRFITLESSSSSRHEEIKESYLSQEVNLLAEAQKKRERLLEILDNVDSADLLARASLVYLSKDPDSYRETNDDRSSAHIEYLALQALHSGIKSRETDPLEADALTAEAVWIVRDLFGIATTLIGIDSLKKLRDNPEDNTVNHSIKARLQSLGVRTMAYPEHQIKVIHGCMDPFDKDCREKLGFTASEALEALDTITSIIEGRLKSRLTEGANDETTLITRLKRERRGKKTDIRIFPDELLSLPWEQAKQRVQVISRALAFQDAKSLALLTAAEISEASGVELSVCLAFLEAFTCSASEYKDKHHAFPVGAHPVTLKPIIKIDEKHYLIPVVPAILDAIRPQMEDLIKSTDKGFWDRYVKTRGEYVESAATSLLSNTLPGSASWTNIDWKSQTAESDLDGLVSTDDVTFRIQCKAGRLSAAARRGGTERMKKNLKALIEDAANQHRSLQQALNEANPCSIGFNADQAKALERIFQVEVIVCLDDLTPWSTETRNLRNIGILPDNLAIPWVISLTDLMAVVDLLEGSQLVHFLTRRLRIENMGKIEAHDELDWVGHYIFEGLFFDRYFEQENPPDAFRLLSYTGPIDDWYFTRAGMRSIPASKPAQSLPPQVDALIQRLEQERPHHWLLACLTLLHGDTPSMLELDSKISTVTARSNARGWSNLSQVFNGQFGLTFWKEFGSLQGSLHEKLTAYARKKLEEFKTPFWIIVAEGFEQRQFVVLESLEPQRIPTVFFDMDSK